MVRQEQLLNKLLSFSLILIAGCAGKIEQQTTNQPFVSGNDSTLTFMNGVVYKDNLPFTGTIFNFYQNSKDTADVTPYLLGKENGERRKYYPNKQLWEKRYFQNAVKVGEMRTFWPNGKPQLQYFFENGEYQGTCKEWTQTGMLSRLMNYNKGYEDGEQKWWYDNGKIRANYVIIDGRRFGLLGTKNCINVSDSIFKK
jgi:antitoxin component YwqK of YwqJK toxin-antitoxin module